ncbi:MAG: alpha-mannosidase [Candidatus Omnitrophota bacterium]
MKTKNFTPIYLTTVLFFFLLSFFIHAETPPNPVSLRLQAIDQRIDIQPVWSLNTVANPTPHTLKAGESIKVSEFTLQTTINGLTNFCATPVLNTPMNLHLELYSVGLSEVSVQVAGKTVDTFEIDGSSGTGVEFSRDIVITPATSTASYPVEIAVKNKGFKPFRTAFWPPRKKPLEEDGIVFSVSASHVVFPVAEENQRQLKAWLLSMKIGYALLHPDFKRYTFIGAPFEIPDKRQTPKKRLETLKKILERSVMTIDPGLLDSNDPGKVSPTINASYKISEPLQAFAKEFKIYLTGNAHIDIAWLWRMCETVMVVRNTFDTVIKNMSEFPELHYSQSQAVTYEWMEKNYPELFEKIKEKVKKGTWEIVGGMWVEPDCNLISGESWVRQLLYGKRYFKEKFGVDVDTGWNPDSFGYNWNMPQLYSKSGIKRFITQKIWWNDTTVFPHFIFWWQGVDGTKLLTYFPPASYDTRVELPADMVNITRYEATTGHKKALLLYGIGDHGGGPNREILNRVRLYKNLKISPEFIHSQSIDFLKNLETDLKNNIPVWNDELYLEYHRGTYTTQAKVKKNNRKSESLLSCAEKLASIAHLNGIPYPAENLDKAWKTVLTNQFHDILPGSSITPVYRDALEDHAKAQAKIGHVIDQSFSGMAQRIDTSSTNGEPLIIFNPLSWKRSDVVTLTLPLASQQTVTVWDPQGQEVPVQVEEKEDSSDVSIRFIAKDVPPVGYAVYSIQKSEGKARETKREKREIASDTDKDMSNIIPLENKFFTLKINKKTGNISGLLDKRLNKEFIEDGKEANVLQVYEDRPERWDAWDIAYTGRMWEIGKADSVRLVEDSPVRKVVKITKSFLGLTKSREMPTEDFPSSFFTQYVILYNDLDRIDIETEADWWEDHMILKAAFPVSIRNDYATYEIPFASIRRTTKSDTLWEKARFEVPALRWADLSDNTAGISILNDCKYGHDIHSNVMKISLLRSPTWPDPMADRGKHTFTYSIYTHPGTVTDGNTVQRAQELNIPLQPLMTDRHPGNLPKEFSFFQVNSPNVIVDTIKKAEDDDGIILRLYEASGKESEAEVSFFKEPKAIVGINLMEKKEKEYKVTGKSLGLHFKAFEIKALKLVF